MGITERREREREEIRTRILDAARELFDSEGYEHVTMRRIAEAIEYSPTTIYNHFEDKDDLVRALCEEDFSRLLQVFREEEPPADPLDWIRGLARAYARFGLELPNHYRFMFMTAHKKESHGPLSPGDQSFEVLRMAVARAIETGQFRRGDVNTVAQVLWSSLHGVVALLITLPRELWPVAPAAPDLVDQTIENGIRGFLATPEKRRA
jgi:AcrR family transcriptional regulator